jgi:hypothetical protein
MSVSAVKARRKHSSSLKASHRNGAANGRALRKSRVQRSHTASRVVRRKPAKARGTSKARRPAVRAQAHKVSARLSRKSNGAQSKLSIFPNGSLSNGNGKDRIMLMARDSFWLHAYWQISLSSVQRAEAALREEWHGAKPILRVFDVSSEDITSSTERHVRDIDLRGSVNNWYIDVSHPSHSYRIDIGYLSRRNRFYALAHSNVVTSPAVGASDAIDEHWASVKAQFERIYGMSGRPEQSSGGSEGNHAPDEHLRRPLGSAPWAKLALGALPSGRKRNFWFDLDAELIVHGSTQPLSRVTLQGERVSLRPDGTFTMRFRLPDKRLIIPATAASPEGAEERTIVLAVERNTKELEPMVHETHDPQ